MKKRKGLSGQVKTEGVVAPIWAPSFDPGKEEWSRIVMGMVLPCEAGSASVGLRRNLKWELGSIKNWGLGMEYPVALTWCGKLKIRR